MQTRMKTLQFIVGINIVFYVMTVACGVTFGNNKDDRLFAIQIHEDLLTVNVKDVPLRQVLMEIANQIDTKIVFSVSADELLVDDFSNLSIEKGLKRLLYDYNHAFIYDTEKNKGSSSKIRKIFVLSKKEERQNINVKPTINSTENLVLQSLIKSLDNKDPYVRKEVVYSLGELQDVKSIDLLSEILLNDKDEDVRAAAADILGDIGGETAIDSLIDALQDEEADVRERVMEALGAIGSARGLNALEGILSDEKEEEVSETAAEEFHEH